MARCAAPAFPMGPFELMDLTGIDVSFAAARSIWDGLGRPDRAAAVTDPGATRGARVVSGARPVPASMDTRTGSAGSSTRRSRAGTTAWAADAIAMRILAAIEAEARRAVAEGVATEPDVDLALRLGAGHPVGPFERARGSTRATIGG